MASKSTILANRTTEGIFAAASYFEDRWMPELFGWIEQQPSLPACRKQFCGRQNLSEEKG